METSINVPTHQQPSPFPLQGQKTGAIPQKKKKKVVQGKKMKPQAEAAEELKEEVACYLEVCDSFLTAVNLPKDIVDVVHMLVRSLNFDVVTIALLDENLGKFAKIASRGYENPPPMQVLSCWERSIVKGEGLIWKKLMKVAGDNHSDLAYWIVQENLDSIGYVPIHDDSKIYGLIFVASIGRKKTSPIASTLLDACGSRLGLTYALRLKDLQLSASHEDGGDALSVAAELKKQLSLLQGYITMMKDADSTMSAQDRINHINNCCKLIAETNQLIDSASDGRK